MGFPRRSIARMWKQYQTFLAHTSGSTENGFLSNQKKAVAFLKATQNHKTNSGRKKIYCPQSFKQEIKNMKLDKRQNQRDIAQTMKVSISTVNSMVKDGFIKAIGRTPKPELTDEQRVKRLFYILDQV